MSKGLTLAAAALAGAALLVPTAAADPTGSGTDYPSDGSGYTDSAARCDDTAVEFGRTSRALVAICASPDGQLEYRGVRLSDQASITMPANRDADGTITASNDGVSYSVTPELLLVSEGDTVIYRDAWIEFREPGFSGATSSSQSPTSPSPSSPSPSSPSPTSPSPTSPSPSAPSSTTTPPETSAPETPGPTASSAPATIPSSPTVSTTTVTLTPTESD